MADLQAIKDEVTNNPVSLPYLAMTEANAVANAEVINNSDGNNPRTVNNTEVNTGDIRGNVTFDAFDGLVTAEQAWLEWLTTNGVIPVTADTLQQLAGVPTANQSIWATGDRTEMNAAMDALMRFQGSRAQEIESSIGVSVVSPAEMRDAANLP